MSDIPVLWLWISGIFFFFGIVAFSATVIVLYKIVKLAEELKPRVDSLTTKVEALVVKVDSVADRVDETMASVKHSVDGVGGRAAGIMGALESVAVGAAGKLEGITPIITGALAAYRIFMAVKSTRAKAKVEDKTKALPRKK